MKMLRKRTCLRPGCEQIVQYRGLCQTCYNIALNLVNTGKTTWEELEKRGKSAPTRRKKSHDVRDWLLGELDEPPKSLKKEDDSEEKPLKKRRKRRP